MVAKNNVSTIITFCEKFVEKVLYYDAIRYFPGDQKSNSVKELDDFFIAHDLDKFSESGDLDTRNFSVYRKDGTFVHNVTHYHFKSWQDFELPSENSQPLLWSLLETTATQLIEM